MRFIALTPKSKRIRQWNGTIFSGRYFCNIWEFFKLRAMLWLSYAVLWVTSVSTDPIGWRNGVIRWDRHRYIQQEKTEHGLTRQRQSGTYHLHQQIFAENPKKRKYKLIELFLGGTCFVLLVGFIDLLGLACASHFLSLTNYFGPSRFYWCLDCRDAGNAM